MFAVSEKTAVMIRRHLAAAHKAWLKKAQEERGKRFFLAYRGASCRVADF